MRRSALLITGMVLCTALWAWQAKDDKAAVALQAAIKKESVDGDLKGAIEQYKKVAQSRNRTVAAKALVRMGECYDKLGDTEARKAYERVVREFGDQKEQARDAEERLAATEQKTERSKGIESALVLKASRLGVFGGVTPDGRLSPFIDPQTGDIAIMDLRTGMAKRLTHDARGTGMDFERYMSLVLSRDGRKIACIFSHPTQKRQELRVVNVDGGGAQTVQLKENIDGFYAARDWSPDGKSVLFTVRYSANKRWGFAIVDSNTGEVRRIPNDNVPFADTAVFSRDGRWIVFSNGYYKRSEWDIQAQEVSTGKINPLVAGGGANHKVVLVPDRDTILFRSDRNGKNGIWSVQFQDGRTTGPPELVKADSGEYDPVGVSRDGTLFYSLRHESSDIYQAILNPQTLRVEGQPVRLVNTNLGRNKGAAWSPSGKSFAYYTERDGEAHVVIRHEPDKEVTLANTVRWTEPAPVWCGDGSLLVWGIPNSYTIRLFDAATGKASGADHVFQFVRDYPTTISSYSMGPSPDCSTMYVYNQLAGTKQRRIYRYDMSTREEKDLVRDSGDWTWYSWPSPDGRWLIASGRLPDGTSRGLLILSTSGGSFRMLDPEADSGYAWAPDSKRVLYARRVKGPDGQAQDPELYWIPIEGGEPQPVGIRLSAKNFMPSLNADGRRLLYSSGDRRSELWVLRNLPLK